MVTFLSIRQVQLVECAVFLSSFVYGTMEANARCPRGVPFQPAGRGRAPAKAEHTEYKDKGRPT
jgi:hypothetical protein